MNVPAMLVTACLLAADVGAQQVDELLERQRAQCPFEAPTLTAADPAEVAWAADRLPLDANSRPHLVADLRRALRAMNEGGTAEHRRALLHLLHAALTHDVAIPIADLRFEPEGRTRIPWIALQARAATKDGRELFELFHRLDETTDAGWEAVGGALAIRGHGAFAIELRTHMQPTLRVHAGRRPADENEPKMGDEAPTPLPGFPPAPTCYWDRDKTSIVSAASVTGSWNHAKDCKVDPLRRDRAQLRWLAELTGERDPVGWAARFDACFRERDMAQFEAFAQDAELRARDALGAADAALRRRFKLPERLALPGLKVVYEDCRREADRKAQAMPERK